LVYPQNRDDGFRDYAVALSVLNYFHGHIGPYPYRKLANVQSKTKFGGMENASAIFYAENLINGKGEQEPIIAHEEAHQWFGNSVTERDWHHVWLSEGFATYFANSIPRKCLWPRPFGRGAENGPNASHSVFQRETLFPWWIQR